MTSLALDHVRSKALDLPERERAELAHDLLASLDGPADEDAEGAWATEIESRVAELDSGKVEPIAAEEVARRITRRVRNSR